MFLKASSGEYCAHHIVPQPVPHHVPNEIGDGMINVETNSSTAVSNITTSLRNIKRH